jgi:hypothetical protein
LDGADFDRLTEQFVSGSSRRTILRGIAAAAAGTLLAFAGQDALAARCRPPGQRCRVGTHAARTGNACCTGDCDPETLRCPCPDGQHYCRRSRTCAACCDDGDCGEGETCHNGICQPLLGDIICGDHEVHCYFQQPDFQRQVTDFIDIGTLGKFGYRWSVTKNSCRPSEGCGTLDDKCNATFNHCYRACFAAAPYWGSDDVSSCIYP